MSSLGLLPLIVLFAALIALPSWGFISAKMQARPWRMLALGLAVTIVGAIQQFKISLPSPVIDNHPDAAKLILEIREMLSVAVSVLLSMGGALMGSAVSLQASRLHADESNELQSALEDTELLLEELEVRIAATAKSSEEDRDWLVDQLVMAADRRRTLEEKAEKLGLRRKRRNRSNKTQRPPD